jgi:F-type H+-transporting ATPase subunit delta
VIDAVTQRYAEALFNVALRQGALAEVERDLGRLAGELQREGGAIIDPRIPQAARRARLAPLLTGAHKLTHDFIDLLFEKRRESVLLHIGQAFHARALRERGEVEGLVESARPLPASEIAALEGALALRLKKKVSLKNRVREDLLGGVRILVESRLLDHSVQGHLGALRKRMAEAPLPSARS